mmetsp:Transcript_18988/g.31041  ORF Transcript_18988/g.31041 Transcript_18988/m.31041 type:complete len:123 (+) Transcript_18988:1523-1891(+)
MYVSKARKGVEVHQAVWNPVRSGARKPAFAFAWALASRLAWRPKAIPGKSTDTAGWVGKTRWPSRREHTALHPPLEVYAYTLGLCPDPRTLQRLSVWCRIRDPCGSDDIPKDSFGLRSYGCC